MPIIFTHGHEAIAKLRFSAPGAREPASPYRPPGPSLLCECITLNLVETYLLEVDPFDDGASCMPVWVQSLR
ncbi:Uncharacterized protein HZ326_3190 [Fusarium oxysporum f. sp. albedinis]|nr:Uncharacterized protein HZ326_3190 [Fusarium oxysporum f. sp. albedinis]